MPLDTSRIKALCFDVDGTLNDTDDLWVRRLGRFLPGKNAAHMAREIIMAAETPANFLYRLADTLHLDDDLLRLISRRPGKSARQTGAHHERHLILPGVADMLELLGETWPMTIVSARDEHTTLEFLEHYNLTRHFAGIVTSQSCQYTKPYPHPVLYAAGLMDVPPENCLMIGDTTVDIRAGQRAGAQTVGVLCGFGREKELRKAGADAILETTSQIAQLFFPQSAMS